MKPLAVTLLLLMAASGLAEAKDDVLALTGGGQVGGCTRAHVAHWQGFATSQAGGGRDHRRGIAATRRLKAARRPRRPGPRRQRRAGRVGAHGADG